MPSTLRDRFVAEGASGWWESEEGVELLQQIESEVRSRYRAEFERAGRFKRILLEHRMRREIAAERARVLLETHWAER